MADLKIDAITKLLEAYGIGVRAGVLTPCLEDEAAFRKILELPEMPENVKKDWSDSDGVRRPITLQRPAMTEDATGIPAADSTGETQNANG